VNLAQCVYLNRYQLHGTWIRALHPNYLANPLGTAHATTHATRFNPGTVGDPGFEILYLAENALVARFEVQALLGSPYPGAASVPNTAGVNWTLLAVQVDLQAVVDLTRLNARNLIDTSIQELTGDWRAYALRNPYRSRGGIHGSDVPTQMLGRRLARIRGVEGFLCYSARIATQRNLMIFPRKLQPGSQLSCVDPATGDPLTLP
jgi:RES domain